MKKAKSFFSCAAVLFAVAGISLSIPVMVHADENSNGYDFQILEDGTAKITNYDAEIIGNNVTIPNELDGHAVTEIGQQVFQNAAITSVTIPEGVTAIGDEAFESCTNLTTITIPNSVTSIGSGAFANDIFNEITIPDNVQTIGEEAFKGCSNLTTITIGESVSEIGNNAFQGCTNLTTLNYALPESNWNAIEIGNTGNDPITLSAVKTYCKSYTYDVLDGDPKTIRITKYSGKAKNVIIPDKFATYDVTEIGEGAFEGCTTCETIVIPESVTSIGKDAFNKCSSLIEMTIPGSVAQIGQSAFYRCEKMNRVTIEDSETVLSIGQGAFQQCDALQSVTLPSRVTEVKSYAFSHCDALKALSFSGGQSAIAIYACQNCSSLQSVIIPESVTAINDSAFVGCTSLNAIFYAGTKEQWDSISVQPNNEVLSNAHKYYSADSIKKVFKYEVTEGSAVITDYLAEDQDCVIPAVIEGYPVTEIDDSAFYLKKSITSVTIPEGVTRIGECAFLNQASLVTVSLPSTLRMIEKNAFSGCKKLAAITLPEGLVSIGEGAFQSCDLLAGIDIPASVTSIGNRAFYNCASFASVSVNALNATYQSQDDCLYSKGLGTLYLYPRSKSGDTYTVPGDTDRIEEYAFYNNRYLTSVTIPAGVTAIGNYAFSRSGELTSVTLNEGLEQIGSSAFAQCTKLTDITLPASVTEVGENVFYKSGLTGIAVASDSTHFKAADGVLYTKDGSELVSYLSKKEGTSYAVPAGVTKIRACALYGCSKLETITLPEGLKDIGEEAFGNCTNLTSIVIPASVTTIKQNTFSSCPALTNIYYKGSQQQWEQIVSSNSLNMGNVEIEYHYGAHVHQFAYTKEGQNVTVKCMAQDCSYTTNQGYTATITAANKTYDGSAAAVSVVKSEGFPSEVTVGAISYVGRDGTTYTASTAAPVNAGKYTASVTVGTQTVSVDFEIQQSGSQGDNQQGGSQQGGSQQGGSEQGDSQQSGTQQSGSQQGGSQQSGTQQQTPGSAAAMTDIQDFTVSGIKNKVYTGKAITQSITVSKDGANATFETEYQNNTNVGTAVVVIKGTGSYTGTIVKTFEITKAKQTLTVKTTAKTVKLKKVKKKKQTVSKAVIVSKGQGKVTYTKVAKGSSKALTVNKTTGRITVKKGTKKGTYKIRIKVAAAGDANYKAASKTVTVSIKVK